MRELNLALYKNTSVFKFLRTFDQCVEQQDNDSTDCYNFERHRSVQRIYTERESRVVTQDKIDNIFGSKQKVYLCVIADLECYL